MSLAKSYAAASATSALAPWSFERRAVRAKDVAIDIRYCGICHSDIHLARDEWGMSLYPMVPGHEITGVVREVGPGVTKFKVGDPVGVGCLVNSCRTCSACQEGLEQYCEKGMVLTYSARDTDGSITQGGYSDHIVVDEDFVLHVPGTLPLDGAAPLLCAGITLYSPLRHWAAGPGKRVAVVGMGGLGHMGVKLAKALGAEVTVLSQTNRKRDDALKLGADHFFATAEPETFQKLRGAFDLIVNTVSAPLDWNAYVGLLRRDGSFVVVGAPPQPIPVSVMPLIFGRRSIAGSAIGGIAETQEMLDLCGRHGLVAEIETIPIQKVNEAYERVLQSDVRYRFVIDMASLKD